MARPPARGESPCDEHRDVARAPHPLGLELGLSVAVARGHVHAAATDYVLVEEVDGVPQLVFGEHDRGSEPIDRFVARKVALYSALAAFPEVCVQQFGIATFRVHVTAIDPLRAPIARLRSLIDAARSSERPDIFRFTLGGWLYAYPAAPIWFTADAPPTNDSVAWADHAATTQAA